MGSPVGGCRRRAAATGTGLTALLVAAVLSGCTLSGCTAPATAPREPESATRLTATLVGPTTITLQWTGAEPDAAGRVVEFATERRGGYTILQFVPPSQTTFTHPDLMPETPFYYRVRPFYGPASPPVRVTLPPGAMDASAEADNHEWAVPRAVHRGPVATHAIRNAGTVSAAAPTDLQATVVHANGIRFTWTDHAGDEEGYLLEARPDGQPDFSPVAVLDPDVNSVGLVTMPDEKEGAYRVRAFYYGGPSNVARQKTGPEP